ncbi:MAG: HAD family hydrolase [Nanoarchaeota archaeon]|nr:HAD family hydrolase [Nanoarchaeota archaeon]
MKLAIFDYNGLLVNDLPVHEQAYVELAKRHGKSFSLDDLKQLMHTPTRKKVEWIIGSPDEEKIAAALKEKQDIYINLAKKGVLFPDTRTVIESLSQKYKLAIVSNSTRYQIVEVFPKELLEHFSVVMTYEDITKPKPAPDSILDVLTKLSLPNTEACYVGDELSDIKAGKAAQVLAIGVPSGYHSAEKLKAAGADVVIGSLSELEAVLEKH